MSINYKVGTIFINELKFLGIMESGNLVEHVHDSERDLYIGMRPFEDENDGVRCALFDIYKGRTPHQNEEWHNGNSPIVSTHHLRSMHSENIAWLNANHYQGYDKSGLAKLVSGITDFLDKSNRLVFTRKEPDGSRMEISLYSEIPMADGSVYMPVRVKTIHEQLFLQNADLEFRALMEEETKELCDVLGVDFNIYTYATIGAEGMKAETWVRFTLPFDQRSAKATDALLEKKLANVTPTYERFMQLSYVH